MDSDVQDSVQISAVIPTYNRDSTIARAIDSALSQKCAPAEIIVVDDGSRDHTRKIVEGYGEKVRYVYQENAGVSAARNRGVGEAKHDWIAFLDSDDYWLSSHLERVASAIKATRGEAALYFSDIERPQDEGGQRNWERCGFKVNSPYEFKRDAGDWVLMLIQPMMLQASVIRRASYLEIGGLPKGLRTREDTLLFFKLGLLYPVCAVSGCGGVMTSDGKARLTREMASTNLPFWFDTISMYKELLEIKSWMNSERRKYFIDKLSGAYFGIARVFFQQKRYLSFIRNLVIAGSVSPSRFANELRGSLGGVFSKEKLHNR